VSKTFLSRPDAREKTKPTNLNAKQLSKTPKKYKFSL
jgi:hypothetical protein